MTHTIQEVTGLSPVRVNKIYTPSTIGEIQDIVRSETLPISVGGGRYSMGGQTAITDGIQIDMRKFNRILLFDKKSKHITVEAGITWRDIQDAIDPYNLSIMTMQTYSNFTVGGSLSVNVHGRYIGYGPLILSVVSIQVVLANGTLVEASRTDNSDIFFAAIGGYGGMGIIVTATLHLKENVLLERTYEDMDAHLYGAWFQKQIKDNKDVIFHNADIYPPHFHRVRATSWVQVHREVPENNRLIPRNSPYTLHKKVYAIMTHFRIGKYDFGKWFRERVIDPILYRKKVAHSRNYEASYDAAELEPESRTDNTYVLEEFFCPVDKINVFVPKMREIFERYNVNVINVSIRHALPDDGSLLAWAREEVYAFVVYYNQETTTGAKNEVGIWTREMIDMVLSLGGTYYLPYILHATHNQFYRAYPRFDEYKKAKNHYDPNGKFSNMLLDKYYFNEPQEPKIYPSRFQTIYENEIWSDAFYRFLQNIFHIAPTSIFHEYIRAITLKNKKDKSIYEAIQIGLDTVKPSMGDIRYGIPALYKQKNEIANEISSILPKERIFHGYLEIGGAGRYIRPISKKIQLRGLKYLISDEPIDYSIVRILERGRIAQYKTTPLQYTAADFDHIDDNSLELVTICIGLHHAPLDQLPGFLETLSKKVRKGGMLILRDHDVRDSFMHTFVAIAHDIYNAGTGASWDTNEKELRHFRSTQEWKDMLASYGFIHEGRDVLQEHDPTLNTLMGFIKK